MSLLLVIKESKCEKNIIIVKMELVIRELTNELLGKYKNLMIDLNNGYPLKENDVSELWELMMVIDCIKFGGLNYSEYTKALRKYE